MDAPTAPRLELRGALGSGATGSVVLGVLQEPYLEWPAGTEVAVKTLHAALANDAAAVQSFRAEAQAGAKVRHPGLVRTIHFDAGTPPRIVMLHVPGETLRAALAARGPLPEPLVRSVGSQIAGGLAALHARAWLHNDVKPENIRLDAQGHAVLLDLGFALKLQRGSAGAGAALDLAHAGGVNPGSLPYLAPERARGESPSEASDVFALGVALYELATGRHPFVDDSPEQPPAERDAAERALATAETGFSSVAPLRRAIDRPGADRVLAAMASARYVPPSRIVPRLSPFLDQLLEDCLRRDPAARPSAAELARRLEEEEGGEWWRAQLDLSGRRHAGVLGSTDATHLTPLVGRTEELERLRELYAAAVRPGEPGGGGRAVSIRGVFGSGKSRLMSDFAADVRKSDEPPLYLYARCSPEEDARPAASVLRLLQRYLQLPPGSPPGARERAWLARVAPPKEAETLARALDPGFEGATGTSVPAALARWLAALGRGAPLIVFLDDLNFASEATIETLSRLADDLPRTRILLALGWREEGETASPELVERLLERLRSRDALAELHLGPLSETAVEDMVMQLFHHTAPRLRIAEVLFSRSRGNPGLLGELLRGLMDRGEAQPHSRDDSRLVLGIPPDDLPLPESLQTMIRERFLKLPSGDRAWLGRLAVVGGRIDAAFLTRAFHATTRAEVDAMLARLIRAGWLVPAGGRYRFTRPALREAVYRSLRPARRRRLHVFAAQALLPARGRSISVEDAFQRAFHLRAAEQHATLLRLLEPLIPALARRGQPQRVHALARWGLEALDALAHTRPRDRLRIRLLEAAADASDRLGYRADQRQWLDQLSNLDLAPEEDAEALARVYLLHGRYAVGTGQYGLARGMLRNAVELAEKYGLGEELQSEALRRLAAVQTHVGELADARKRARAALDRAANDPQRALAWISIGLIDVLEDDLEPALAAAAKSLTFLRATNDWRLPGVYAAAYMLRGRSYRLLGMLRRAMGAMDRAVRLAQQAGERRLEMEATARLGGLLLDANRPDQAEARLRDALLIANEIEDRRGQTLAGIWLAVLLVERNDPEAERLLTRVQDLAREMGLSRAEAMALAIRARILHHAGRMPEADERSRRAMELVERNGAELADRVVITGTRAIVLDAVGEAAAGRALVKELRGRLRRENRKLGNPLLRRSHRIASTRLLEEVLTPEGPIYPRVDLEQAGSGAAERA